MVPRPLSIPALCLVDGLPRDHVTFWTANVSVYKEYKETNILRHDGSYLKLMLVCSELYNLRLNFCCGL